MLSLGLAISPNFYLAQILSVEVLVVQQVFQPQTAPTGWLGHALSGRPPMSFKLTDDLQKELHKTLEADSVVAGATLAIVTPNQGTWVGASGYSDLAAQTAMVAEDRFQIASLTKPFVATVVLQLMEEGKLGLEDPVDRWLPPSVLASVPFAEKITIRQLLNHTSGIHDYTDPDTPFGQDLVHSAFRSWRPQELVAQIEGAAPYFAPGAAGQWHYSNTNYILLGLVVEAATGSTVALEIRRRILEPLRLRDTFFAGEEKIAGGFVRGYWDIRQQGNLDDLTDVQPSSTWAAGAMVSNAADVARFTEALFGGELLKSETLNQMLSFVEAEDGGGYGLGISRFDTPWGRAWGHTGSILGYESLMLYLPDSGVTAVALLNQRGPLSPAVDILDASLGTVLGRPLVTRATPTRVRLLSRIHLGEH